MFGLSDISVSLSWSPFLFIFLVVGIAGFTYWTYRRTVPPVSRLLRALLIFLRSLTLVLTCFVIFGPVLKLTFKETRKATVGLLIDNSSSMQVREQGRMRGEVLRSILSSEAFVSLYRNVSVRPYFFSDRLVPLEKGLPDSIPFDGTATDIAGALSGLRGRMDDIDFDAVILLSDGRYNIGGDPIRIGEGMGCPVYTVTLGESTERPDLILSRVLANEITYVDNRVPVEVSVRGAGFAERRVSVRLSLDDEVLDEQIVSIPPNGLETSTRLHFTPRRSGFQKVSVGVTHLDNELTYENNDREIFTKVLERKHKIFLFADAPSPDFTFISRILKGDDDSEIVCRTQKDGAMFYEGDFLPEDSLRTFDLFIFLDVPSRFTPPSVWRRVSQIMVRYQKPFFFVAGKQIDFSGMDEAEALLPFTAPQSTVENLLLPKLTSAGLVHPVLRIFEDAEENRAAWQQLPPLFSSWRGMRVKPGCEILATGIPEKKTNVPGLEEIPLIVARHVGEEKSVALFGYGLYRWDLLMRGIGGTNDVLKGFLRNAVRWLIIREEEKQVRITMDKLVFRAGEEIFLSVQVYDEMYRPVEGAIVQMTLFSLREERTFVLADMGGGRYSKEYRVFESGTYRIEAEASVKGRPLGKDEAEFSISSFNPEFLNTKADPVLMENLARISGGMAGPADSLGTIIDAMDLNPQTYLSTREITLTNLPWMLGAIILLLCFEWLIRKRKGMV